MEQGEVTRYSSARGAEIYRIPLRAYSYLVAYAYIVVDGDYVALIDTGSGSAESHADLLAGMRAIREHWGSPIDWPDLQRIIITHAHADHYGGLGLVQTLSSAPIAAHQYDLLALSQPQAYQAEQMATLAAFIGWAGLPHALVEQLHTLFTALAPQHPGSAVATPLRGGELLDGRFQVFYTPGHAPGQICLRLDDVLFAADHILADTNPRLTPAHLEPQNGLAAYLDALDLIAAQPGIQLALAGHDRPMTDVYARIASLRAGHLDRLEQIMDAYHDRLTIAEVAALVYPELQSPGQQLLAAQAIAARVEYLVEAGRLTALSHPADAIPARYQAVYATKEH